MGAAGLTRIKLHLQAKSCGEAVPTHQTITTGAGAANTARNNHPRHPYLPYLAHNHPPARPHSASRATAVASVAPHSRPARSSAAQARPCVRGGGWERQVGLVRACVGPIGFTCGCQRVLPAVEARAARAAASRDPAEPRGALRRGGRTRPRPRRGKGASGQVSLVKLGPVGGRRGE